MDLELSRFHLMMFEILSQRRTDCYCMFVSIYPNLIESEIVLSILLPCMCRNDHVCKIEKYNHNGVMNSLITIFIGRKWVYIRNKDNEIKFIKKGVSQISTGKTHYFYTQYNKL